LTRNPAPDVSAPDGGRLIVIGEIVGVHGVRGEARLHLFNAESTVLADAAEVFLVRGGSVQAAALDRARPHGGVWLVTFDGVGTREAADALRGSGVAVRESDLPELGAGQYYWYQLKGLAVVDDAGNPVGTVSDVLQTAGSEVLVVDGGDRERLVPLVDRVVEAVDLARGTIVIHVIDGLFD
jgi:16S rRNA processing protein RimM